MTPAWRVWTAGGRTSRRAGVLAAACFAVGIVPWMQSGYETADGPTVTVRRGAFRDAVVETGTITAAGMRVYGSSIPGVQAKIVYLVAEGREVATGDEIIRFDAAPFELALARDAAQLAQAEADLARAQEDARLDELAAASEHAAAHLKMASAESALRNERDGRGQVALEEATFAEAEAARQEARAREHLADVEALLAKGFATRAEVDRASLDLGRADDQHRLATRKLASLRDFERPAAVDQAAAGVDAARQDLQRAADAAAARLAQRRAVLALAARRVDEFRARVATATENLARTTVRAEGAGLVVYRDLFFATDRRKPQVGDEVYSNQPIIAVPDTTDMLVETRVREVDLHRISASRRVEVTVDAHPDLRLAGSVALVGTLAEDDAARSGAKYFPLTIRLSTRDGRLRPGMTARVEIVAFETRAGLIVPVQVLRDLRRGQAFLTLADRGVRVPVRVVANNGIEALVEGEVEPGRRVIAAVGDAERRP